MIWIPYQTIAPSLVTIRSASRSVAGSFRFLGTTISDVQMRQLLQETLGIYDDMDAKKIESHIIATIGDPIKLPEYLMDTLGNATIAVDDVDLARSIGVDPLRLLMLGHEVLATVSSGQTKIRSVPLWNERRLVHIDVAFTLRPGVTWRRGTLHSTKTQIPVIMLDSMTGRTLDGLFDHPWSGWKKLRVERAQQAGGALVLHTATQEKIALSEL